MLISKKIRLILTPEQEHYAWCAAGTARWAYNQYIARNRQMYTEHKQDNSNPGHITAFSFNKEITQLKKTEEFLWLRDIAAEVTRTAIINGGKAYQLFFEGKAKFPKFHSKKKTRPSFAIQKKNFGYVKHGCKIENMGIVKTAEPLPKRPKGTYKNVTISYDNKYWYVSFSYEADIKPIKLTETSIGIDLGIKVLAMVSDSNGNCRKYKNINKTLTVRKVKKRLKRQQRALSRKQKANTTGYVEKQGTDKKGNPCIKKYPVWSKPLRECKNFRKNNIKIQRLHRRLRCIRNNYLHQVTTEIVKTKPFRIVIEDLNIQAMMQNKHLSGAIQEQNWYSFRQYITYKASKFGIKIVVVSRTYPSSKTCSCCGNVKRDLKLQDRVYQCPNCGLTIDRDLNAAINLAKYQK